MLLELAAFVGIIVIALIVIAELTKMYGLGLIAGVFVLFMAFWFIGDGLQYSTGTTTLKNLTSTTCENLTCETTNSLENDTTINNYADIPTTPYYPMLALFEISAILTGLYLIVHYSMDLYNEAKS